MKMIETSEMFSKLRAGDEPDEILIAPYADGGVLIYQNVVIGPDIPMSVLEQVAELIEDGATFQEVKQLLTTKDQC